jgi:CheY-like chemotaxis protein
MNTSSKILYVEDSPENQVLLEFYLKKSPVEITAATSGNEAKEILEHEKFDIIILDLNLPGETSSTELLDYIDGQVPVFIMTAMSLSEIKERVGMYDIEDYLIKPVKRSELLQALGKVIPELNA